MAVVITLAQWTVFALAASWAICTNFALRQHYKHSDQPTLPANATALTQLSGVVTVILPAALRFTSFGCFRCHISPASSPCDPGSSGASHGFTAMSSPTPFHRTGKQRRPCDLAAAGA